MAEGVADHEANKSFMNGMTALALLREWRSVLGPRLPDGTMEELERDLTLLKQKGPSSGDCGVDRAHAAERVDAVVRRIQGAGLLFFRNQPGVANRFAALSLEET